LGTVSDRTASRSRRISIPPQACLDTSLQIPGSRVPLVESHRFGQFLDASFFFVIETESYGEIVEHGRLFWKKVDGTTEINGGQMVIEAVCDF
jgi:hypothetical protein